MLLYLVKQSHQDIVNVVKELPKVLDEANTAAYKGMHWIQETCNCGWNPFRKVNNYGSWYNW